MLTTITRPRETVVIAPLVCLFLAPAVAAERGWEAGVAREAITPEKSLWMAGYAARDKPAEGKVHELWAKALALQGPDGHQTVAISLDVLGVDRETSVQIRNRLQKRHDLDRAQIAIFTSHTHSGPVVGDNLAPAYFLTDEQWAAIRAYTDRLEDTVVDVAGEALDDIRSAELIWGSGRAAFAINRRENDASEVAESPGARELKGPVDHDVPVLLVRSDGGLRAVLFGYACHATTLSFYKWCGDWPGFAQQAIEERHPGAVALFFAGCGGDQNPAPRRSLDFARDHGRRMADAVDAVIEGEPSRIDGPLETAYREIDLPFAHVPDRAELEKEAESDNRYVARRAKLLLEKLDRKGSLREAYPYPIEAWKLGDDVTFLILGGEVVVDYALRFKKELTGRSTWVAGYANDVMAYIPSRRVLEEGGYEGRGATVYYGRPSPWDESVERRIVRTVHDMVDGLR